MHRTLKIGLWVILGTLIVGATAFVIWAESAPPPMQTALDALNSSPTVAVTVGEVEDWLVFQPIFADMHVGPDTGFIFYPGGRVDPRSYAPAAHALAQAGYLVVITPVPLNLAFFAVDKADQVMAAFPEIDKWAIGGHSLGGAAAAIYLFNNPKSVDGLVLWASYPAGNNSLIDYPGAIASIYGTLDGLATVADVDASRPLLPPQTVFVPIEGGNHAQFGWYGDQSGDNPATISRDAQQAQIIAATADLLASLP